MSIEIRPIVLDHWELAEPISIGTAKVKHILALPIPHKLDDRSVVSVVPVIVYDAHGANVTRVARPLPDTIDIWKIEGHFVSKVTFAPET